MRKPVVGAVMEVDRWMSLITLSFPSAVTWAIRPSSLALRPSTLSAFFAVAALAGAELGIRRWVTAQGYAAAAQPGDVLSVDVGVSDI